MFRLSRRFAFAALIALSAAGARADIVVNTETDEDAANSACSLREAIIAVNTQANYNGCSDPGTTWSKITFAVLPNAGEVHTIALGSVLPTITKPVFIDATTQSGSVCTPVPNLRVQITNPSTLSVDGLTLGAGSTGSTIHGLAISGFAPTGSGLAILSDLAKIGCVISGMDASGTTAHPNYDGVLVAGKFATIGEATATTWFPNLLSGNSYSNIHLYFGGDDALIAGNYIGVDHTGLTPLQTGYGIEIIASNAHIGAGFSDGPPAHQRNVIGVTSTKVNSSVDINIDDGANIVIAGNYIGVGADGHTVLPIGVGTDLNLYQATGTLIGCDGNGTWDYCRNVIANPGYPAISVYYKSTDTAIVSNFINVAANGVTSLIGAATNSIGVEMTADTLIARNVISAASDVGIFLESATGQGGTAAFLNPALAGSGGAPLNSTDNCFPDSTSQGVYEFLSGGAATATPTLFVFNWWGAANGPGPGGSGASADPAAYTTPYLTVPSPYCGFDRIFTDGFEG